MDHFCFVSDIVVCFRSFLVSDIAFVIVRFSSKVFETYLSYNCDAICNRAGKLK